MKNKIMFVCQYFYPEKISSGVLPFEIASKMVEKGFDVYALVGYPKEYSDSSSIPMEDEINGIKIKRINYVQSDRSNFFGRISNILSFCWSVWKNKKVFKEIDKCICYTNPPLLPFIIAILSKKYKFDMFFEIYDLYPDVAIKSKVMSETSIICKLMNYATNYALKKSKKIILLSQEMRNYLVQSRERLPLQNKSLVIPNWYKKQDISNSINSSNKLTVLYGGNMGILQDMDTLLETIIKLKNNPNIDFILAGHGVKKEKIENTVKKLNIKNCKVLGFVPKEEYDQLMKTVDIAVVSLEMFGWGLGSPSKVYSYLALGLPIIAIMPKDTDVVKDIEEYNHGVYIQQENSDELAKQLIYLSENKEKVLEMRNNAISLFNEKYELNVVAKKYEKMFKGEL